MSSAGTRYTRRSSSTRWRSVVPAMPAVDSLAVPRAAAAKVTGAGRSLPGWVVRHRRWIVGAWITLLTLLAPSAARVDQVLDVSARVEHSESSVVEELLRTRFD